MWAIGSIDVALLQRTVLEWNATQYAQWLSDTLVDQLLKPASSPRRRDRHGAGNPG
jgi:hypothetical protein